ncbi:radical SAM protein [Helicobacter turcicus]|uniref:radical SAM protein n=1 Tax=Helicobacter turcicus TaxID=2867412 RepID=UPI001F292833|nr:radical SAM protein [Helicobacter turcicus]
MYLENPVFNARYIEPNISWYVSYFRGNRGIARVWREPITWVLKKFFLKSYFQKRVAQGKVDIPYLELVLTTKCTLRCESCNNLMQYFSSKNQYTCTLEGILESLDCLLENVESIQRLRIIGGEPLMFKDLPQLVAALEQREKVRSFDVLTNGTIGFKEALLQEIKKAKKFRKVSISDYSNAPNLKIPLKQESIFKSLKAYKIPYSFLTGGIWYKVEKIYKRNRTKEGIIANFHACGMSCVSLMSGDVRKNQSKVKAGGGGYFCLSNCKLFV